MTELSQQQALWRSLGSSTRFLGGFFTVLAVLMAFASWAYNPTAEDITAHRQQNPELTYDQAEAHLLYSKIECQNYAVGFAAVGLSLLLVGHALVIGHMRHSVVAWTLAAIAFGPACLKGFYAVQLLLSGDLSAAICPGLMAYWLGYYAWDAVQLGMSDTDEARKTAAAQEKLPDAAAS